MNIKSTKFRAEVPKLDLSDGTEMLTDFSREAQRHLMSARNSLLVLESVPTDREAIEDIFKTFHTIKGLAEFLNLKDIAALTHETELVLDLTRKGRLVLDQEVFKPLSETIDSLQKLLELLDEQITNGGSLKGEYLDTSDLIETMREIAGTEGKKPGEKKKGTSLPTIRFDADLSVCTKAEEQLAKADKIVSLEKNDMARLLEEFRKTSRELKEVQSKLTERQRALTKERELAIKLTERAQAEARAKSEYLANMSHEIRTLINAILGFTELLKEGNLSERQKEHLNTIIISGKMLLGIVNDILDYSKAEAGKLKMEAIDFSLRDIVEEVFKIIRTRLHNKPIHLYFDIDQKIPAYLIGDPTRLKQIFINLVDNAIKFTDDGEIGLKVDLLGHDNIKGKCRMRFTINDTGIGIPEDRQDKVFESFTQASDSTTRLYGGTGLGLALCKNFVETMGGKIWVESKVGEGSRFIFELELPEGGRAGLSSDRADQLKQLKGRKVMIVDAHSSSMKTLESLCRELELDVIKTSKNAKQASEFLSKRRADNQEMPQVIFIDSMMSGQQGFMLAYKIRRQEDYGDIKLVAISADIKIEQSPEYADAGFDIFLNKPIIKNEFQTALLEILSEDVKSHRIVSKEALEKISCEGLRVLVAEDSAPNQELLKIHFEMLGCECDYAANGQEAVEFLRKKKYDICFMDLHMPIMNGFEAAKAIRTELGSHIPIVALTAAEVQEEKAHCVQAGMNDYLSKPFDLDELKQKIVKLTKM